MQQPVCVLLAGGLARRMGGGDKPLRLLGGRTLLDHAIERIRPQVAALALNANGDPARFAAWSLPVLPDTLPDNPGPLAGVLAGMRWAAGQGASYVLSAPTDTPFLPPDLVARLAEAIVRTRQPIACAASGGRTHPVIALWPTHLADALEAALRAGTRKIDAWSAQHGCAGADWDEGPDPFVNINTPDELAELEKRVAGKQQSP